MIKYTSVIVGSFLVATIFGMFGQSIAYFLATINEHIIPFHYLSVLTGASVFFYVVSIVTTALAMRNNAMKISILETIVIVIGIVAILTSIWAIFVWAMWWG